MEETIKLDKSKSHKEFEKLLSQDWINGKFKEGEITTGVVSEVGKKFIFVDLGLKSEGAIPVEEFVLTKEIDKIEIGSKTLANLMGFFSPIFLRLAEIKTPPQGRSQKKVF